MPEVVVYSRGGCKLCASAERIARRVTAGRAALHIVDIDDDPELYERYTVRVPVVMVDGREVAELQVREDDLRAILNEAIGRSGGAPRPAAGRVEALGAGAGAAAAGQRPAGVAGSAVRRAIRWLSGGRSGSR